MYDAFETLEAELDDKGYVYVTEYILDTCRWGHWGRTVYRKNIPGGYDLVAIDCRYHTEDGIQDIRGPLKVREKLVTTYEVVK